MADDEDRPEAAEPEVFEPDGPWCWFYPGQPPPRGSPFVASPGGFNQAWDAARRNFDAECWIEIAKLLDRAAQTGKIRRDIAASLAHTIRSGLAGILPYSWRAASTSETGSHYFFVLGDQQQRGAMYLHAERRGFIEDERAWKTIQERCGVAEKTVERWSLWLDKNRERVEAALEVLLFEIPSLLQDLEGMRRLLLIRDAPDIREPEVSGPDR